MLLISTRHHVQRHGVACTVVVLYAVASLALFVRIVVIIGIVIIFAMVVVVPVILLSLFG